MLIWDIQRETNGQRIFIKRCSALANDRINWPIHPNSVWLASTEKTLRRGIGAGDVLAVVDAVCAMAGST